MLIGSIRFLLLISSTLLLPACGQPSTNPIQLVVQPGNDVLFTCVSEDDKNVTKLETLSWYRLTTASSNSTEATQGVKILLMDSSRVHIANGTLAIQNVTFGDAGRYVCQDDSGAASLEAELIVYDMPGYWKEAGLVIGLAAGLLLVLLASFMLQNRMEKRILSERQEKTTL
ncbi:hypothetical protein RRG08_050710 [Elysia crispata]|uniref:Ig-like domain-containing protein n=1 Tax=Elysia crispata TaxID=231223 RepID=A0AAE1E9I9_9GAST|nr:hypothetical protein RRG08_050710 [Elysia crispata]